MLPYSGNKAEGRMKNAEYRMKRAGLPRHIPYFILHFSFCLLPSALLPGLKARSIWTCAFSPGGASCPVRQPGFKLMPQTFAAFSIGRCRILMVLRTPSFQLMWIPVRFGGGGGCAAAGRWLRKNRGSLMAAGKHGKPGGRYGVFAPVGRFGNPFFPARGGSAGGGLNLERKKKSRYGVPGE